MRVSSFGMKQGGFMDFYNFYALQAMMGMCILSILDVGNLKTPDAV